ncbi:MAG TPA: HD domain-containing phosphohydrolase [Actinomycetota bacterium]
MPSPKPSRVGVLLLIPFGVAGGLLAAWADDPAVLLPFAVLIAVSELFEISLPNDIRLTLGVAPALGYAMLGSIEPVPENPSLAAVVGAYLLGAVGASVVRAVQRRPLRLWSLGVSAVAITSAASLYHAVRAIDTLPIFDAERSAASTDLSVVGIGLMLLVVVAVESAWAVGRAVGPGEVRLLPRVRSVLAVATPLQLASLSVGALLALSYPTLRLWAFPLFLAPLGATQYAFLQFASIQKAYRQTIRALSKVPEMAGYTRPGHSSRVAELSVSIARAMGLSEQEVGDIEYAALLHDIGRVSIPDPADATVPVGREELATVGAGIVRETGHFPTVADMIQRQYDPYRRKGEGSDPGLPIGARIVKVASAYDDLRRPGTIGISSQDALDRISQGMAFEYDPGVVTALRRTIERGGAN